MRHGPWPSGHPTCVPFPLSHPPKRSITNWHAAKCNVLTWCKREGDFHQIIPAYEISLGRSFGAIPHFHSIKLCPAHVSFTKTASLRCLLLFIYTEPTSNTTHHPITFQTPHTSNTPPSQTSQIIMSVWGNPSDWLGVQCDETSPKICYNACDSMCVSNKFWEGFPALSVSCATLWTSPWYINAQILVSGVFR